MARLSVQHIEDASNVAGRPNAKKMKQNLKNKKGFISKEIGEHYCPVLQIECSLGQERVLEEAHDIFVSLNYANCTLPVYGP